MAFGDNGPSSMVADKMPENAAGLDRKEPSTIVEAVVDARSRCRQLEMEYENLRARLTRLENMIGADK